MLLLRRLSFRFSSKIDALNHSTYDQLVNTIVKKYNYQEYKNPSALALLQAHHQYKIFHPGDYVLDVGAGPTYSWTNLALKMTEDDNKTHCVISNDTVQVDVKKQNSLHVRGDFMQQPVQTKIALQLQQRKLNTILVDATKQFTGNIDIDAKYSIEIFVQALLFADSYLKKGGTIVFRTVQCSMSLGLEDKCKFLFNQVYKFRPSTLRIGSPTLFYVLKGHQLTSNMDAAGNFLKQYKGSTSKKIALVEKYRKQYEWDPVELLNNQAKSHIQKMKKDGRSNKQILRVYEDDPFVKCKQILKQYEVIEDETANPAARLKAIYRLRGESPKEVMDLPETQEEFAEYLLSKSDQILGNNDTKKKKVDERAPLGEDELYLKNTLTEEKADRDAVFDYREEDLYGFQISESQQPQKGKSDDIELMKLIKSFPEVEKAFHNNQFRQQVFNNPALNKQLSKEQMESIFKEQQKSDKNEQDDQWMSEQMNLEIKSLDEQMRDAQREYIENEERKSDRIINQRRSKRHLKNKKKF